MLLKNERFSFLLEKNWVMIWSLLFETISFHIQPTTHLVMKNNHLFFFTTIMLHKKVLEQKEKIYSYIKEL